MKAWTKKIIVSVALFSCICLAVAVLSGYLFYADLKRLLLTRLSDRATAAAGQTVTLGDISFNAAAGIHLQGIVVCNPEGFVPGELLRIEEVSLNPSWKGLADGMLLFTDIEVISPDLTIMRDGEGRLNVSEKLRLLLSTRGETPYRIDTVVLRDGVLRISGAGQQVEGIDVTLTNLSSAPGTKTTMRGSAKYHGEEVRGEGWAHLSDHPKQFSVALSARDVAVTSLRKPLPEYLKTPGDLRGDFTIGAFGDTKEGFSIEARGKIGSLSRVPHLRGDEKTITLEGNASYGVNDDTLTVKRLIVLLDNAPAARLTGIVKDVRKIPTFKAEVTVEQFDLARIPFSPGIIVRGLLHSDRIALGGRFDGTPPRATGILVLDGGAITTSALDAREMNVRVALEGTRQKFSLTAEGSAKLLTVGPYRFGKPVSLATTLTAGGGPESVSFRSSGSITGLSVALVGDKEAGLERTAFEVSGRTQERTFSGEVLLRGEAGTYAGHHMKNIEVKCGVGYASGEVKVGNLSVRADSIDVSGDEIRMVWTGRNRLSSVEARNLRVIDRRNRISVDALDMKAGVELQDESSFHASFSIGSLDLRGFRARAVAGRALLDRKVFLFEIPGAEAAGGRLRLSVRGRTSGGPFPVEAEMMGQGLSLSSLDTIISEALKKPYTTMGVLDALTLRGTLTSPTAVHGDAVVEGKGLGVRNRGTGRTIVKDASLGLKVAFRGNDLDFRARGGTVGLSVEAEGSVSDFAGKDRSLTLSVALPKTKLDALRTSLWDVFPDGLLYARLEGSLSSDISIALKNDSVTARGEIRIEDITIEGENDEFSLGPMRGVVPIAYEGTGQGMQPHLPMHDRSEFENLRAAYAKDFPETGYSRIDIGSFRYGFPLLGNISVWVKQRGRVFDINRLSATMFGGTVYGSAVAEIDNGFTYRAGLLMDGLSLRRLCDSIDPIRDYLSGKVNGVGMLKGSGTKLTNLIGAADFWTFAGEDEKTVVGKEFLRKIGGPSLKGYLGDRSFDKGIMSLLVKDGDVVFKELELSNRNVFGVQDLSVKVAPFSNRISIDHLLWSLVEAAGRMEKE